MSAPLRVSYCRHCAAFNRDFLQTIARLQREYPAEQLRIVALECMVACDTPPVAMIEYDLLTGFSSHDFYQRVVARLEQQHTTDDTAST